jgi:hypothetical protein
MWSNWHSIPQNYTNMYVTPTADMYVTPTAEYVHANPLNLASERIH